MALEYSFYNRDEVVGVLQGIGLNISDDGHSVLPNEIPDAWPISERAKEKGFNIPLVAGHLLGAPDGGAYLYLWDSEHKVIRDTMDSIRDVLDSSENGLVAYSSKGV